MTYTYSKNAKYFAEVCQTIFLWVGSWKATVLIFLAKYIATSFCKINGFQRIKHEQFKSIKT